jgi:hypothetical protein
MQAVAAAAVRRVGEAGRRSCDALAAKLYYYYSWTHELTGGRTCSRGPVWFHAVVQKELKSKG